jgi:hypothetical protein
MEKLAAVKLQVTTRKAKPIAKNVGRGPKVK